MIVPPPLLSPASPKLSLKLVKNQKQFSIFTHFSPRKYCYHMTWAKYTFLVR